MIEIDIYDVLSDYFGYDQFKNGQKKIVEAVLEGKDALGIMPTGGGKSLCYQLPSILLDGLSFVISPLISLMKDQVDFLNEIGVPATFLNSTLDELELNHRIEEIKQGKYKLIYIAPERLNTYLFKNLVKDIKIAMVAVDEAHCISQWGHDFRPSYREIPKFINSLSYRPVVSAYTATATQAVLEEIKVLLELHSPVESIIGFDRPNLFYEVNKVSNKFEFISNFINKNYANKSGIIYCATRKTVESISLKLNQAGFNSLPYHGGMNSNLREKNQDKFIFDKVDIIVATNAFGMGIDKPDVRFVIHYNMPQNMESYYQEAGRAGRDGEPSHCILLYSPADTVKQKLLIQYNPTTPEREKMLYKNLQYLEDYCHTNDCLRNKILSYFGEEIESKNCKNCGNCLDDSEMVDISVESQKILSCIYRVNQRFGSTIIAQVLKGSKNKRILQFGLDRVSTYGIMKDYDTSVLREMIMTLVSKGYINMTSDKFPILKLNNNSMDVLRGKTQVYHKKRLLQKKATPKKAKNLSDNFNEDLYSKLKEYRYELAMKKGIPPFMIFHDSSLKEMASLFPIDKSSFLNIKGVGTKKYESYGRNFIKIIDEFLKNNDITPIKTNKRSNKDDLNLRYENTYKLYEKGLSLDEISRHIGFVPSTVVNHLQKCEEKGKYVNWNLFLDESIDEEKIITSIEKLGTEKLKDIKEDLPEEFDYLDIKIVMAKNKIK